MKSPAAKALSDVMSDFPGVKLLPGFHVHRADAVHLPLNEGLDAFKADDSLDPGYFEEVAGRALLLLEERTDPDDGLLLVTNGYPAHPGVISRYLKRPELKYRMDSRRDIWQDGDERIPVSRLILPCKMKDIRWRPLLLAISGQDFGRHPRLRRTGSRYPPDVFVLNETKREIFYMYDDRGCDVLEWRDNEIQQWRHEPVIQ